MPFQRTAGLVFESTCVTDTSLSGNLIRAIHSDCYETNRVNVDAMWGDVAEHRLVVPQACRAPGEEKCAMAARRSLASFVLELSGVARSRE